MRIVIVVPARYGSSRFPGKPLAPIAGKPLLRHVVERCARVPAVDGVVVATDHSAILQACVAMNAAVVRTSSSCRTGTDRVWEAASQVPADIYVNVQGDEPLVEPDDIARVIAAAREAPGRVHHAMCAIDPDDFHNANVPKVVVRPDGRLLYASRAPIPASKDGGFRGALKQVCIYAMPRAALAAFAECGARTPLEDVEDVEILRFLELGIDVHMVEVSRASVAVDVPGDVHRVEAALAAAQA